MSGRGAAPAAARKKRENDPMQSKNAGSQHSRCGTLIAVSHDSNYPGAIGVQQETGL